MNERCKFCGRDDVGEINEFGACKGCDKVLRSPQMIAIEQEMMTDYEKFRARHQEKTHVS